MKQIESDFEKVCFAGLWQRNVEIVFFSKSFFSVNHPLVPFNHFLWVKGSRYKFDQQLHLTLGAAEKLSDWQAHQFGESILAAFATTKALIYFQGPRFANKNTLKPFDMM